MNYHSTHLLIKRVRLLGAGMAAIFCMLAFSTANAQSRAGNLMFGFDVGSNKYYGNFTGSEFGFDGDVFIHWDMLNWLGLEAGYNGGQLRYAVNDNALNGYPQYFGTGVVVGTSKYPGTNITIDPTNVIRTGGWDVLFTATPFPSQSFVPYFIAGPELLNFEPKTGNNGQDLPNNAAGVYNKYVLGGILGLGFDMYINNKVTFNGKIEMHLTGTDWLDDYSNPSNTSQDAFLTFGLGFAYVIFSPPEAPAPRMHTDNYEGNNTYNNNTYNTTINHRDTTMVSQHDTTTVFTEDTIFMKSPSDTIFLLNPKLNAIYNYPGTLFIVNTDQFNMSQGGNADNLNRIKELVVQCPDMRIEVQGFASDEGTPERNQELSEQRALRIKTWLIAQGVNPEKISNTVGYGTSRPLVVEPVGGTAAALEAARVQNRRIAIRVVHTCE